MAIADHGRQDAPAGVNFSACTHAGLGAGQSLTRTELFKDLELAKRNLALERHMTPARDRLREQAKVLRELARR